MRPRASFRSRTSGQISGGLQSDQSISTKAMGAKLRQVVDIIRADPAVDTVVGFTGGGRAGGGFMFVNLKPRAQRTDGAFAVIARLRPQLAQVTGLRVFLNPVQDLRARRAQQQLHLPVHAEGRQPARPAALGRAAGRRAQTRQPADRRQHRPAGQRRRELRRGRQGQRGALRHHRRRRRRCAVRRVRPARGQHDLWRDQPVQGDHGVGAGLHAGARRAGRPVRAGAARRARWPAASANPGQRDASTGIGAQHAGQHDGAAGGHRALQRRRGTDLGAAPGHRDRHHGVVQPRRRRVARPGATGAAAGAGQHRHADQRARRVRRHGAELPAVAGPAAVVDRRARWW